MWNCTHAALWSTHYNERDKRRIRIMSQVKENIFRKYIPLIDKARDENDIQIVAILLLPISNCKTQINRKILNNPVIKADSFQ